MRGKVIWITGQSNSGKTTLAQQMKQHGDIILDGDSMRALYPRPAGFKPADRREHNLFVARLAKDLSKQGAHVIVALICPFRELRDEVQKITNCSFIYLSGGERTTTKYPYEIEDDKYYFSK